MAYTFIQQKQEVINVMNKYMLILVFSTFIYEAITTCPSKCNCKSDSIYCVEQGLEDVPIFETSEVDPIIIDLSGNKLISIDIYDFSFERNTKVKELYLNNSQIIDIEDKAFDELINLQELYLNNNNLKDLPRKIIMNNKNLIVLDISNNIFERFPVLNSTSLEVLAVANSGISSIVEKILSGLPSLKVLLLEENKLTHLSPAVFDGLGKNFVVKLAYNAWRCDCDTIRLFDFLNAERYTEITTNEPIQCLTEDKTFIDIYYSNGTSNYFKEKCKNRPAVLNEVHQIIDEYKKNPKTNDHNMKSNPNRKTDKAHSKVIEEANKNETVNRIRHRNNLNSTFYRKPDVCSSDEYYDSKIILFVTVPVTFLIGMLFGCYLTFSYGFSYAKLNITESSKKLLSSSVEGVVKVHEFV